MKMGMKRKLCGKTWKDNENMEYGEIKRKAKVKRMRVLGKGKQRGHRTKREMKR